MLKVGDLVNNLDTCDYNYGMVLDTHISITDELIEYGATIEPVELETEPPGARVLWSCGDINIHYFDELEVINEVPKLME